MSYLAEYTRPYPDGYVNLPSESTPEMAEFLNARDDVLIKIEQYLANLNSEYALLTEAGYSLFVGLDANYVLTINLQNKNGKNISHKTVDLPIESMIIDVDYVDGKLVLTLQNGNTVDVDVSDMVRGLVPTTRKIAGIDLADDITKEELVEALDISSGGGVSGDIPTKVSQLENDLGYVTQEDIIGAETVSAGEIKPWLYNENEEVIIGTYNGKPLYRKTVSYDVTNINYKDWFSIVDMTDYNTETLVSLSGTYQRSYQNTRGQIEGKSEITSDNGIVAKLDDNIIWCCAKGYNDLLEILVILEYTKTTDAEGSGNDLKPYGIYDAKLDDIKAEIDEVKNAITETTETTMPNSHEGRVLIDEIGGVCEQGENPSPTSPQEIKESVVSGVKTYGKNFLRIRQFDSDVMDVKGVKYTIVRNSDGTLNHINVNGTATETSILTISLQPDIHLTVGESYVLSGCPSGGNTLTHRLQFYNINGNNQFAFDTGNGSKFVFTNETTDYNVAISVYSGVTVNNLKFYPMLRRADIVDDTYEPYKESSVTLSQPINLYKIGDVQDVIEDGKVKRRFVKMNKNHYASMHISSYGKNEKYFGYILSTSNIAKPVAGGDVYSSHLTLINDHLHFNGTTIGVAHSYPTSIGICVDIPTVEEVRNWLIENDVEFIYQTAEEVTEALPTADQIALNSLATYDGITYLEFDSEIEPTFKGEYGTSKHGGYTLESLLTARNNDLRLSSLEASVVNNI